jgi:hypothetical protein
MPNVWVGSDQTDALMIQMTRTGTSLSGTLDDTSLDSPDSTAAKAVHAAFTGAVDHEAVTLTFPQGLGFSTSLSGTLSDRRLSLRLPQDDGAVATVTLQVGSVDDYNRLVAAVNGRASANASASRAAAVQAADVAAEDEARHRVDVAAKTVAGDVMTLQSVLNDPPDFGDFDANIAAARDDLAATKKDAKEAATDDGPEACSDAYAAQSDQYAVQSDSYGVDSDMDALIGNIDAVDAAVDDLNDDLDAYHSAAAGTPGYGPAGVPDEKTIQSMIGTAHSTPAGWRNRSGSYKSTVAKLLAQATAIADQAVKKYC